MTDPLADVVASPRGARCPKVVSGAGSWRVRRSEAGQRFYCVIWFVLSADGHEPITLQRGDFVLIPSAHGFVMTSLEPT